MILCIIKKNNYEILYFYRLEFYIKIKKENLKNIYYFMNDVVYKMVFFIF